MTGSGQVTELWRHKGNKVRPILHEIVVFRWYRLHFGIVWVKSDWHGTDIPSIDLCRVKVRSGLVQVSDLWWPLEVWLSGGNFWPWIRIWRPNKARALGLLSVSGSSRSCRQVRSHFRPQLSDGIFDHPGRERDPAGFRALCPGSYRVKCDKLYTKMHHIHPEIRWWKFHDDICHSGDATGAQS